MYMNVAFCKELNADISISNARDDYRENRKDLHFLCSDPNCVQDNNSRTQISAVNYKLEHIEENNKQPHFKLFKNQKHKEKCFWTEKLNPNKKKNETKEEFENRIFENNCPNFITDFILPSQYENSAKNKNNIDATINTSSNINENKYDTKNKSNPNHLGHRQTKILETFVVSYIDLQNARNKGDISEVQYFNKGFKIHGIDGKVIGSFTYNAYFRRLEKVIEINKSDNTVNTTHEGIFIADCNYIKSYKDGSYLISFSEYKDENKFIFYLSKNLLDNYKYKNNFIYSLEKDETHFIKAYFMNPNFNYNSEHKNFELSFTSLDFLIFVVAKPKKSKNNINPTSQP